MDLDEAKDILELTTRYELRSDDLGDVEVMWVNCERPVASGYFDRAYGWVELDGNRFTNLDAHILRKCGVDGKQRRQ